MRNRKPLRVQLSIPEELDTTIKQFAHKQEIYAVETVISDLVSMGFEEFERDIYSGSAHEIIDKLTQKIEIKQSLAECSRNVVTVHIDRDLDIRIRASAKEYKQSVPDFYVMMLANGARLVDYFPVLKEIKSKNNIEVIESKPNKDLIASLERVLEEARKGELQGCIMICSYRANHVNSWWIGIGKNRMRFIGELEQAKWQLCSLEPL